MFFYRDFSRDLMNCMSQELPASRDNALTMTILNPIIHVLSNKIRSACYVFYSVGMLKIFTGSGHNASCYYSKDK